MPSRLRGHGRLGTSVRGVGQVSVEAVDDVGANAMKTYTTATASTKPFNVEEVLSLMRAVQEECFSHVMDFNADALASPCCVCGNIMTMDNRGDVTMCEHVMDAIRRLSLRRCSQWNRRWADWGCL
ncbi:hypothetical protein M0R72_10640 [Candidatus Pacearchaeota archaeon]|nr:hypothetical protein [Candidatus Pacearchaeota archaeon]